MTEESRVGQTDRSDFLAFVECAGCGEHFPVRSQHALNRAKWCSGRCRKRQYQRPCATCGEPCGGSDRSTYCTPCGAAHRNEIMHARAKAREDEMIALRAEGLLNYEIADRLGTTAPAVATILWRARKEGISVTPAPITGAAARNMGATIVRRPADA